MQSLIRSRNRDTIYLYIGVYGKVCVRAVWQQPEANAPRQLQPQLDRDSSCRTSEPLDEIIFQNYSFSDGLPGLRLPVLPLTLLLFYFFLYFYLFLFLLSHLFIYLYTGVCVGVCVLRFCNSQSATAYRFPFPCPFAPRPFAPKDCDTGKKKRPKNNREAFKLRCVRSLLPLPLLLLLLLLPSFFFV